MRGTGAARRRKGDGIGPESVPLAPRRGKNRRLREVPRHLQGRCATDSAEGDKSGRRAVSLGALRGARVMGRPEGETPPFEKIPLGPSSTVRVAEGTEGDGDGARKTESGQKSLAVPELGGIGGLRARNRWQCQC